MVAVAVGLHRIGDVWDGGGPPFGQPARELLTRLQRGVRQRFGDHAGSCRSGRIDRAQHVVADRRRLWPPFAALGELGEGLGYRWGGDGPAVVALVFGPTEG